MSMRAPRQLLYPVPRVMRAVDVDAAAEDDPTDAPMAFQIPQGLAVLRTAGAPGQDTGGLSGEVARVARTGAGIGLIGS